jgi:hypothetical protein
MTAFQHLLYFFCRYNLLQDPAVRHVAGYLRRSLLAFVKQACKSRDWQVGLLIIGASTQLTFSYGHWVGGSAKNVFGGK